MTGGQGGILVLGGTREARTLAALLDGSGVPVTTSLAGRVSRPALPVGGVRVGGFGGADGLARHLREEGVRAVVDATHPFAATISANAAEAARATGVPLLRLQRPGWEDRPEAAGWHWVDSTEEAVTAAEHLGERTFVTTGRQSLPAYAGWTDRFALVRVVDPLDGPVPAGWQVLLSRGPYDLASETALMREHRIDVLTTKNSGGPLTEAKLQAAADLGVAVVVVRRPAAPAGIPLVTSAGEAADWVAGLLR
ncbi:precorrin-6A/cobalt-precorrin-6A reductase [Raineyella antarctica]|uniref:Precorrin-6A/cobalt-precorrin-6A reductase n=1 Tax=Raineyella antarctica TaxID=1577474 RepID=A0A1G6GFE1_9ACTN|nr:cobalt-precorrin-6A reductase [Raineyella antarctica]SDB80543.1 precorrin-6A/cobalt-precorrin-6A reductase [Raineyella antarctica]